MVSRRVQALLDQLRAQGIQDEQVLNALAAVPREKFVDEAFEQKAWDNIALPPLCTCFCCRSDDLCRGGRIDSRSTADIVQQTSFCSFWCHERIYHYDDLGCGIRIIGKIHI